MIREAIIQLAARQDLSYDTAAAVMDEIMSGQASQIQMASFLTALAIKGETIDEITACAAGMRAHCVRLLHDVDALEIVGTGGDGANSFNISTTSACRWPSTEIAPLLPNAVPPMCWSPLASTSHWRRSTAPGSWPNRTSVSCSHRTTISP